MVMMKVTLTANFVINDVNCHVGTSLCCSEPNIFTYSLSID